MVRKIERDGWQFMDQTGSHRHFLHETKPGKVTVDASGRFVSWSRSQHTETGGAQMTRTYLVVYEKTSGCWGGYSPDVPGFGSAGDTLEEMRAQMIEGLEGHLSFIAEYGDALPEAVTTVVDFSEETPANGVEYCVVEWLEVRLPAFASIPVQQASAPATTHDQGHHG